MILTQAGADVVITFDGVNQQVRVTLENTTTEQLENAKGLGNFRFDGQSIVTDSLDVWKAAQNDHVVRLPNIATFLNALDNQVDGSDESSDVINGLAGNDTLNGLAR
jgi:hypothetical protein